MGHPDDSVHPEGRPPEQAQSARRLLWVFLSVAALLAALAWQPESSPYSLQSIVARVRSYGAFRDLTDEDVLPPQLLHPGDALPLPDHLTNGKLLTAARPILVLALPPCSSCTKFSISPSSISSFHRFPLVVWFSEPESQIAAPFKQIRGSSSILDSNSRPNLPAGLAFHAPCAVLIGPDNRIIRVIAADALTQYLEGADP